MTTIASVEPAELAVEPGRSVMATLNLRNAGDVVHGYHFEVLGDPAPWVSLEPNSLTLYPGKSASVRVTVAPPRNATVASGDYPFAVHVVPVDTPQDAVIPEALVSVLAFHDLTVELVPKTTQGSGAGRHDVAVDNRGNVPITMRVSGGDPNQALRFSDPDEVYVPAGQTAFGRVGVKPAKRLWRGQAKTLPFMVSAVTEDDHAQTLDGVRVQTALLPKWLGWAVAGLAALAAVLVAMWFGLVKPTVRADAKDAAAPASSAAAAAASQAAAAQNAAQSAANSGGGPVASTPPVVHVGSKSTAPANAKGSAKNSPVPISQRLAVQDAPGGSATETTFTVPGNRTLDVTDLSFENPQGDDGPVTLSVRFANGNPDQTLYTLDLQNFRDDEDYHFVSPIALGPGDQLVFAVNCAKPGTPLAETAPTTCNDSLDFGGTMNPSP